MWSTLPINFDQVLARLKKGEKADLCGSAFCIKKRRGKEIMIFWVAGSYSGGLLKFFDGAFIFLQQEIYLPPKCTGGVVVGIEADITVEFG